MSRVRGIAVVTTALFLSSAGAAIANGTLDLAWDNCAFGLTPLPSHDRTFACDGSPVPARLYATFRVLPPVYPKFAAMEARFDLEDQSGALPDFWAFEAGGCNESALTFAHARPAGCGTTDNDPSPGEEWDVPLL